MEQFKNLEIIQINTVDGKLEAILSYQDTRTSQDINNGYGHITVPVNIRALQLSVRDNVLVNQSVRVVSIGANHEK